MQNDLVNIQGDILVVDDVVSNLRVLSNILSNRGHLVRCVRNGALVMGAAKAAPPDVILLDIRMPEIDGYEVCRRLKSEPKTCDIPIIFLSALDEVNDKAKAFEMGGVDYITKPIQVEEVLARVQNQLTIQHLKKQLVAQQLPAIAAASFDLPKSTSNHQVHSEILSAIATIIDYSDRLSKHSTLDSQQSDGLRVIHQAGQTLLTLMSSYSCESER